MTPNELLDAGRPVISRFARLGSRWIGLPREEVFNELVVCVLENAHRFDPQRGKVATFVRWQCRGVLARRCWARWKRDVGELSDSRLARDSGDHLDPATIAEQHELADLVGAAVSQLQPRERQTITARFGLGGDGEREHGAEIAAIVGTTPGACRTALVTGRRRLRDSLADVAGVWLS